MIFVPSENRDPRINLAIEQYLLKEIPLDEPISLFYINESSVIIGRSRNTIEEINRDYVGEHGTHVICRLNGGGTTYHDFGNSNFSFITPDDGNPFRDFTKITQPIIQALHELGVTGAKLKDRNDLVIDGMKFSGNATYVTNSRMFAHGTIMFDSNTNEVVNVLKVKKDKIESKGIKPIHSRMTNIKPFLSEEKQKMITEKSRQKVLLKIFGVGSVEEVKIYKLTDEDWKKINQISREYYRNWGQNYGKSPDFDFSRQEHFSIGLTEVHLNISGGIIKEARTFSDFFGLGDVSDVEEKSVGQKCDKESLSKMADQTDVKKYFGAIESEELLTLLY